MIWGDSHELLLDKHHLNGILLEEWIPLQKELDGVIPLKKHRKRLIFMEKLQVKLVSLPLNSSDRLLLQDNYKQGKADSDKEKKNPSSQMILISSKYHNHIGIKIFKIETSHGLMRN